MRVNISKKSGRNSSSHSFFWIFSQKAQLMQSTTCKSQSISLGGCGVIALMFRVLNEWSVGAVVEVASTSWTQLTQKVHSLSGSNHSLISFTQGTIDGVYNKWLRAFPWFPPKTPAKIFLKPFIFISATSSLQISPMLRTCFLRSSGARRQTPSTTLQSHNSSR